MHEMRRNLIVGLLVGSFVACFTPLFSALSSILPVVVVALLAATISRRLVKPRLLKPHQLKEQVVGRTVTPDPEFAAFTGDWASDVFALMLTLLGLVGLFAIGFSLLSVVGFFVNGALKPAAIMLESVMRPLPIKWQLSLGCFILWLAVWNTLAIRRWGKNGKGSRYCN